MKKLLNISIFVAACVLAACNETSDKQEGSSDTTIVESDTTAPSGLVEETVDIPSDTSTLHCFVAFDASKQGKKPVVLVVPEWWGLNDFPKNKARELAQMGYLAMAVDIYGNGVLAADPTTAGKFAGKFYGDPQLASDRIRAALDVAKSYPQADSSRTAAIGFCFGGSMVLNAAKMGMPLDGVVSFHGGLAGVAPSKNVTSKILVCHGGADGFVPAKDVTAFRKQLDSAGINYTFKEYPGASHAFTNPEATATGQKFNIPISYNESAATAAWSDMKSFFATLWP